MRRLDLQVAIGTARVSNGLDSRVEVIKLVALVTGDTAPDISLMEVMETTGGSWNNTVKWLKGRSCYLVSGQYNPDPNYGDTPGSLDRRLRHAVGDYGVSFRYYDHGVLVAAEGALGAACPEAVASLN